MLQEPKLRGRDYQKKKVKRNNKLHSVYNKHTWLNRLKINGWKKIYCANTNQKQSKCISDKIILPCIRKSIPQLHVAYLSRGPNNL